MPRPLAGDRPIQAISLPAQNFFSDGFYNEIAIE